LLYYSDYLQLDKLLDAQHRVSEKLDKPVHDEMLFIIIHQAYELWFKQIIFELDWVLREFAKPIINDAIILKLISRFERILAIFKLLVGQISILETMTPMDFLNFRDYLIPASGFQSFQFRLIETKLGLRRSNSSEFQNRLSDAHRKLIVEAESNPSLFELVETWLARTPFVETKKFSFLKEYRSAIYSTIDKDEKIILENSLLTETEKQIQHKQWKQTKQNIEVLFDPDLFQKKIDAGDWRLSHNATTSALFISLYRHYPILNLPYRILSSLINVDALMTQWRSNHVLLVKRMVGTKIGTGGSSGSKYLEKATRENAVFQDFANLVIYMMPSSTLPDLSSDHDQLLGYLYQH